MYNTDIELCSIKNNVLYWLIYLLNFLLCAFYIPGIALVLRHRGEQARYRGPFPSEFQLLVEEMDENIYILQIVII